MKLRIVSRARLREPSLQERFTYYQKLLRSRMPIELQHAKKSGIRALLPKRHKVIALDEAGHEHSSVEMAQRIAQFQKEAWLGVAFIIGEADGLSVEERSCADELWSLSRLTLPHQMCIVLLAEQLYRSSAILRGEPYHRA